MRSLLLVNVGPVQDFIASARRSRDLWFGSWLLSELSKAAALAIAECCGVQCLIFPAPVIEGDLKPATDFNVGNKIVAVVDQPPATVAEAARQAIMTRLEEIQTKAFGKIEGKFDRVTAKAQVNDLVEFYWAAVPLAASQGYQAARRQVEAIMAARKATRDFDAVGWGKDVPKSSLDGLRESVIDEDLYDQVRQKQMKPEKLRRQYGVGPAERLCGVGLLKRHGQRGQDDRFFSTSHVAALPLLRRLADSKKIDLARSFANRYFAVLKELGIAEDAWAEVARTANPVFDCYDGHLLFEERLSEYFDDDGTLKRAQQALHDFLCVVADGRLPLPYYALLQADGDHIGKVIDHQNTLEKHQQFSQALAKFATAAKCIVTAHEGSLVYAGGDDVLAFVPLHTVLGCARELAARFAEMLAGFADDPNNRPTLSVGVAVCHHLEPLSDALELAHKAEKAAKGQGGRNALAVTVSKRSGSDRTVYGKWGALDRRLKLFERLHRQDEIPDGAAYELHDLALRLGAKVDGDSPVVPADALQQEALRILGRKRAHRGQKELEQETVDELRDLIENKNECERLPVDRLADELIVARIFADAANLADPLVTEEVQPC